MTWNRHLMQVFVVVALQPCWASAQSTASSDKSLFAWIENAVQWDAIWHRGAVPCKAGDYDLAKQLQGNRRPYQIEWTRTGDTVTAIIPELHRMFLVQTTREDDLGRIQIRDTCATSLQEYLEAMASRKPVASVTDPGVERHLDHLQRDAAHQAPPSWTGESPIRRSTIAIGPPAATQASDRASWPMEKRDALESIIAAAMDNFSEFTEPGTHGQVIVPDFQLNDPEVILVVFAPNGACVLPVGFERRVSVSDPHIAYPTGNCLTDPDAVTYYSNLVQSRKVDTQKLLSQ